MEVQIKRSRRYLPYLNKIFDRIVSHLEISPSDAKIAERMLDDVCLEHDVDDREDQNPITIRFDVTDSYITIEVHDLACQCLPNYPSSMLNHSVCQGSVVWYSSGAGKIMRIHRMCRGGNKTLGHKNLQVSSIP